MKKTDRMLTYLILASISTGFWTAVLAIITIIVAAATPTTDFLYLIPYLALPSIYINSVLCNLNIRQPIRRFYEDGPCISLPVLTNDGARTQEPGLLGAMKFSEPKGVKETSTLGLESLKSSLSSDTTEIPSDLEFERKEAFAQCTSSTSSGTRLATPIAQEKSPKGHGMGRTVSSNPTSDHKSLLQEK